MDADKIVKPPKHRLTCDNCKKSKVRCNQKRPECSRCLRQGVECIYGLSHRAGRPRLNRSLPKQPTQRNTQPVALGSPTQSERSSKSTDSHASSNTNAMADSSTSADGSTDSGTNTSVETCAEVSPAQDMSTSANELCPLSTANMDLPWATPTSIDFPVPNMDTEFTAADTDAGLFNLDFDGIFAPEPFNGPPEAGLDFSGAEFRPPEEERSCSCGAELLNCLFETAADVDAAEDGAARVLCALTASKRLLDNCQVVLCCANCTPRWSTALMLCHTADQIVTALDMGSVWTDSANPRYYPQANALAREDVLLRCGNYIINGAKRRLLLRSMLIRRLKSLQETMNMARYTIDSLDLATATPYQKTLASLVAEVFSKIRAKVELVSMSL